MDQRQEPEYDDLCRTTSIAIETIQSTRLRRDGTHEERSLREGIEREVEIEQEGGTVRKQVIGFQPGDPENPHNWSYRRKYWISTVCIVLVVNSTFSSSVPSGMSVQVEEDFGVSSEVVVLLISLFLLGYVIGPVVFAPLSEFFGRRWVSIGAFTWYTITTICCAVSPNMASLLVFRFFAGLGASAPISVTGGIVADIWSDPSERGLCMAIFSASTMLGPVISPIVSGFLSASSLGWRMSFWVCAILAGVTYLGVVLCPETFAPTILRHRAEKLRKAGHVNVVAPSELESRSLSSVFSTTLTRPFRMLGQEAIVFSTSLFLSLIYGTFYLDFEAYPIIFQGIYGFRAGIAGLPFIPVGIGAALACFCVVFWDQHLRRRQAAGGTVSPEYRRLPLACVGGPVYCISLFWLAWSSRKSMHWMAPVVSGVPFGFGLTMIFISFFNYMADAYEIYAASALAAASMLRSIFGAAFPLFGKQMYSKLGVGWAGTLLGFLAVGFSVIPFLFIYYGETIRNHSKFCQFLLQRKQMFNDGQNDSTSATDDHSSKADELESGALDKETCA